MLMNRAFVIVVLTMALSATIRAAVSPYAAYGEGGDTATVSTGSRDIEACRAAALVLLEGMQSSRNALPDEAWLHSRHDGYRPPGLASYKDLAFDDPLVPYGDMSYEEKLLAWGYPAGLEPAVTFLPRMLAQAAYVQYKFLGRTTPDLLWMHNAPVWPLEYLEQHLAMLISPVTGKLIAVDCKEFSRGNAYVRVVTEAEVKELVELAPSVDHWWNYASHAFGRNKPENTRVTLTGKEVEVPPHTMLSGKHEPYLVYVRLYGEKGVLVEGLF